MHDVMHHVHPQPKILYQGKEKRRTRGRRRDFITETEEKPCLNVLGGHLTLRGSATFVPWMPEVSSFITTGARIRRTTCALTTSRTSKAEVT